MFGQVFDKTTEDFFDRQADEATAEMRMIGEQLIKANLKAFSLFDPDIKQRYDRLLRETGSPALAEIGAISHAQQVLLQRAFSVFDDW
jgi:hypothetical protein